MKKFALTLVALFALGATQASAADVTKAVQGAVKLKGNGKTRSIGFHTIKFTDRCAFTAWGVGTVTLPVGAKYRTLDASQWRESNGNPISGLGAIRVRLENGMSAKVNARGGTASRARLGGEYKVKYEGTGKFIFGSRMDITSIEGKYVSVRTVPGQLPPDDVN